MSFEPFDPLQAKTTLMNEAALGALKREITNILSSYVGWYDPFCELIQNALDAVDLRAEFEKSTGNHSYYPLINIIINQDENSLTVTDNGIGLEKDKFQQFLAPNFSFKTGATRGHKGVGATYVAYGFNYMRISTKLPGYEASGRIVNARTWLDEPSISSNPKVEPDNSVSTDPQHDLNDRGVSITVKFDDNTHPKQLNWIKADSAEVWTKILSVKTGLGAIVPSIGHQVIIKVIHKGKVTEVSSNKIGYLWLHESSSKKANLKDIQKASLDAYNKYGDTKRMKSSYRNLDFIYDTWSSEELLSQLKSHLDEEDMEVIQKHNPSISFEYGCTSKLWKQFNESLGLRKEYKVLTSGIQLAANNMPQGETILIPLNRNIGRQNQLHFLFHFDNYTPDLGRKGFHRELSDFSKNVSKNIADQILIKYRNHLKPNTGIAPDFVRETKIDDWKNEMETHEAEKPLILSSDHFFIPTKRVSITSAPTREQDVIALFNQLVAGGVIRGIRVMSTNERFTYDGLYKVAFDLDPDLYIYDETKNPLGVTKDTVDGLKGKVTKPRVLEYKYSLDGLLEDFESNDKNIHDIDLCIAWETGELYKERYALDTLLIPENADMRQYHGVTHILNDMDNGSKHCDLIILSELVEVLNDPFKGAEIQRVKYD